MEKDKAQKPVQHEELQLDEFINWSFRSYEDEFSSEEDNPKESMARWIFKRKRKCLPIEKPNQQMVQDLIINTKQQELVKKFEGHHHTTKICVE